MLCKNVNLATGEILITATRKNKERIVVLSEDMRNLAIRYTEIKNIVHPDSPYFFSSKSGKPYTEKMLAWHFKNFVAAANPGVDKQQLPNVRIYDPRHRFAATVMIKWIDERRDLCNMLPIYRPIWVTQNLVRLLITFSSFPKTLRILRELIGMRWARLSRRCRYAKRTPALRISPM